MFVRIQYAIFRLGLLSVFLTAAVVSAIDSPKYVSDTVTTTFRIADNSTPITEVTCNFDAGLCAGWTFYNSSESIIWTERVGESGNHPSIFPQAGQGFVYANFDAFPPQPEQYAELRSSVVPVLSNETLPADMTFWYKIYQRNSYGAVALQLHTTDGTVLWKVTHGIRFFYHQRWLKAIVKFCLTTPQALILRVSHIDGLSPTVALDEIITRNAFDASCQNNIGATANISCDFRNNFCGWSNQENEHINWLRFLHTANQTDLPGVDNYYIRAEPTNPSGSVSSTQVARLVSRTLDYELSKQPGHLSFYYRWFDSATYFAVKVKLFEEEIEVWRSMAEAATNRWAHVPLTICRDVGYQLVFESNAAVDLDDIVLHAETGLSSYNSTALVCPTIPLTCDFEHSLCGWRLYMDQAIIFGLTQYESTAAASANGTSHLITTSRNPLEVYNISDIGLQIATLHSDGDRTLRDATTLSFWYYSVNISEFYLHKISYQPHIDGQETLFQHNRSSLVSRWTFVTVDLCDETDFILRFSAWLTSSDQRVGIDTIVLHNETALTGELPSDTFVCPGNPNRTITCSFDDDRCMWKRNDGWTVMRFSADLAQSGNGFMRAHSWLTSAQKLTSRMINAEHMPLNTYVSFYYRQSNRTNLQLLLTGDNDNVDTILWRPHNDTLNVWISAGVTICAKPNQMLQFTVKLPQNWGGLAEEITVDIDEFVYYNERDYTLAIPGRCPVISCGFQSGTCGWTVHTGSSASWNQSTGVLVGEGSRDKGLSVARLFSPCLRFLQATTLTITCTPRWDGFESVKFKLLLGNSTEITLREYNECPEIDQLMKVSIPPSNSSVRLVFEAAFTSTWQTVHVDNFFMNQEELVVQPADQCSDLPNEQLIPIKEPTDTLSCGFNWNMCGWSTGMLRDFSVYPAYDGLAPANGDGYLLASRNSVQSLLGSPWRSLLAPTQMFFYYYVRDDVDNVTLHAELDRGLAIYLWKLSGGDNIVRNRWIPVRINLCITGRFRLMFTVKFVMTPGSWYQSPVRQPGDFGLDELVINNEVGSMTSNSSAFVCPSSTLGNQTNSITCDTIDPNSGKFCGWSVDNSSCVNMNTSIGGVRNVSTTDGLHPYALIIQPHDYSQSSMSVLESPELPISSQNDIFTFWYVLRGTGMTATVSLSSNATITVDIPMSPNQWNLGVLEVGQVNQTGQQLHLTVYYRNDSSISLPGDEETVNNQLFALGKIWYSAELGYQPLPQPDQNITITSSSTTTTTVALLPPASTTTVAPTSGPSDANIIIISVCSVAGVLILLGATIGFLRYRRRQRPGTEKAGKVAAVITTNSTEMVTRDKKDIRPSTVSSNKHS